MQSLVVHIRHIPGLKYILANCLSRLKEHVLKQKLLDFKDLIDDNRSCLLFTNQNLSEYDLPEKFRELSEVPDFHQVNAILKSEAGEKTERV